jgi:hypothetical protein
MLSGKALIHPISLSFKLKKSQREYSKYHVERSLKLARIGLMLGMMLYMTYSLLDRFIVPRTAPQIFLIRIAVSLFFLLVFGVSFTKFIYQGFQLIMSLLVLAAGFGIIWMILISDAIGGIYYYAGLILVIIYAHGISRLRFIYASLTTWIIVIIYESHIYGLGVTPPIVGINNTFFLLSSNLLGMFSSYALEYYMRTAFWQNRVLHEKNKQVMEEHKRKTKELDAARQIQLAMLPHQIPAHPDIDLFVSMKTATEIGGDYYDFHVAEDDTITFALGDATGHGAQAGAMVTATKFLFSNYAANQDIIQFLSMASRSLGQMRLPRLYMALAIGRIQGNTLQIAGVGLPPAFLFRSKNKTIEEIPLKGIPLGGYGSGSYQKKIINLSAGDSLILMTDGLPEQCNDADEEFGYDKIENIFAKVAHRSPAEIIKKFNKVAASWGNGNPQRDDMTFLVVKIKEPER